MKAEQISERFTWYNAVRLEGLALHQRKDSVRNLQAGEKLLYAMLRDRTIRNRLS